MITKKCCKCNEIKDISNFNKRAKEKDGYNSICRECIKILRKKWDTKYSQTEKFKLTQKKYRDSDKGKLITIKWYENNKERALEIQKKYRHTEKGREKERRYYNSDKGQNCYRKHYKKYSISKNMAGGIRRSLKNDKQGKHWEDLVEYTLNELKEHLKSQFQEGMSWDNYGEWHIDHIKPLNSFDPDTPPSIVNALDNLQPLWATTREINGVVYEGNLNKGVN